MRISHLESTSIWSTIGIFISSMGMEDMYAV
jgi:hypothetical protein